MDELTFHDIMKKCKSCLFCDADIEQNQVYCLRGVRTLVDKTRLDVCELLSLKNVPSWDDK